MHDVGGDLHGLDIAGPDTWSPDGEWIYFNAGDGTVSHVFRANVPGRFSQQLTANGMNAYATASSPNGKQIAFIVAAAYGFDLWTANSDGTGAHRILGSAGLGGWSADGQFILVRWKPPDNTLGGLGTVRPDGTDLNILIPYGPSCRTFWDQTCELGFDWGRHDPEAVRAQQPLAGGDGPDDRQDADRDQTHDAEERHGEHVVGCGLDRGVRELL